MSTLTVKCDGPGCGNEATVIEVKTYPFSQMGTLASRKRPAHAWHFCSMDCWRRHTRTSIACEEKGDCT